MLYAVSTGTYVESLSPQRKRQFDALMERLSSSEYDAICDALIRHFQDKEVDTSSWIPGNNWTGTVYEPIHNACNGSIEESGKFFGLILFDLLMKYEDVVWGFLKAEKDGAPLRGTTYFRIDNPPPR